jgi:hypothetical protein
VQEYGWSDAFGVEGFAGSIVGKYYNSAAVYISDDVFESFFKHILIIILAI